ncbi:uncharacterized protein J3D65DRAFT_602306 [Phyllosticta citribraziliensis]|uniref:Uncharacterized protein n=1 Tax=Phyllosticta citribraziliensis TaxID=989973 RepID=A0ABR1LU27_9PEZI
MQRCTANQLDVRTGGGWQGQILKFVAGQVENIVKSRAQGKDMGDLTEEERHDIWAAYFRRNPLGVAKEMWKPISAVDYDAIFYPPESTNDEIKAKLQACHDYILQCWILAAENSFLFRILAKSRPAVIAELKQKKETEYTLWKNMPMDPRVVVPSIEDIPVTV